MKKMWPEWPSTHQCTIQKIPFWDFMDGMKLSPGVSLLDQYFYFFRARFFSLAQFFFFLGTVFLSLFFGPPLTPSFFGEAPTYPNPPTSLLPTIPLTSLILLTPSPHPPPFALTSTAKAFNLERAWVARSFRSAKSTRASRVGSIKSALARGPSTWWQEERESKRSFKVVAKVGAWR